ncbi:ergothioneine biosynthesis protein EgtB [Planococcus sp. ISL-110]|uniref:ergothioneine biosynthesis protein EgtB n=1 Tax=Planococcus sp. ISL-110 TaxID=2819167 RepID=UPI001BECE029|nr:ergothioneine biosynthesis protein EgtB [Planococcus sp. ISL-110]MBT2572053.1 ergothioneine biosynthesis protein EgtB [Planococcus sp. ISL-110]
METMDATTLIERYAEIRKVTMKLIQPLETEDFIIQSHSDVSPPKWHIAHTTWFFERIILKEFKSGYQEFNPTFDFLFNSYYNTIGPYQPRHERGVLSRPTVEGIIAYRNYVDGQIRDLLSDLQSSEIKKELVKLIEMGLQHEQQHQELILMDVKYNFFVNPLFPVYLKTEEPPESERRKPAFIEFEGGLVEIGHNGEGFSFDNESPRHKVWLEPFKLATEPVTNGEYLEFIEAGGYEQPEHWLSDGWAIVKKNHWKAPLYWLKNEQDKWGIFTLGGVKNLDLNEPVCHVSFYESDAFSRWKGKRLPTEAEWEHASQGIAINGNTLEQAVYQPVPMNNESARAPLSKMFGDVWEWTSTAYSSYPGSKPLEGALGEYNAKFMSNQMILRGGSCATPASHIRETYRNFFPPEKRWQFGGFRLADDQK